MEDSDKIVRFNMVDRKKIELNDIWRINNKNRARLQPRFKNHGYSHCPTLSEVKYKGKDVKQD